MAEKQEANARKERRFQVRLEGLSPDEKRPEFTVTALDRNLKPLYEAQVSPEGDFQLPEEALKNAHRIMIGPKAEEGTRLDPRTVLRYRPGQFLEVVGERGILDVASRYWKGWYGFITCVTGSVRRCRPIWPWYVDKLTTFNASAVRQLDEPVKRLRRSASLNSIREELGKLEVRPWPVRRCQVVCKGIVEVYRRTCCCRLDWLIEDPRLPKLIRELEELVREAPVIRPWPPLPDPPPDLAKLPFLKDGAVDEKLLNARQDLAAIRSLPSAEVADYIRARRYLWWCSCGRPVKVGQGPIQPDGTFNICWFDFPRVQTVRCYDQYAYVVKQRIHGIWMTIYNGLAAGAWFDRDDDPVLTSYSPRARVCRDNGPRDDAYVYLELIGDTEAWHLKTPDSTGWDRVASPAFNDGLAFPSDEPAAGSAPYDRNWGGLLKLYFKFSEGLKDVGARYYRLSITAADGSGDPTGSRDYYGTGLSWEKSVGAGVTVPVSLGPNTVNTENNLYAIPYDSDADWDADQYHAYLNTNAWTEGRHLLTLEIFDQDGKRLRPPGTPPTGQPGVEIEAPFTYRRQFQDLGPSANVPFGALTHMLWWDNRPAVGDIFTLRKDGLVYNAECQYLQGLRESGFSVDYNAYHPEPLFHDSHTIWWYRGSGTTPNHTGTLTSSAVNTPSGTSGVATFEEMLLPDAATPARLKCSFVVHLSVGVKTFDGENILWYLGAHDQWAFSIEING